MTQRPDVPARPCVLAAVLLWACALAAGPARAAPCPAAMCVTTIEVDGQPAPKGAEVLLRAAGEAQDRKTAVTAATTLADGAVVETPTRPRVRLVLTSRNGNVITLQPGARLEVRVAGDGGERYTHWLGEARFAVTRALGFFEVAHDKFVAAVKGTEFGATIDPQKDELRYDWVHGVVTIEHEVQVSIAGTPESAGESADAEVDTRADAVVVREVLSADKPQLRYRLNPTAYRNVFGNFADAERFYNAQLAADRASGDPEQVLRGLSALSAVLARIGKRAEAAATLSQALEIAATLKTPAREALIARRVGELYTAAGEPAKALPVLERALALERQIAPRRASPRLAFTQIAYGRAAGAAGNVPGWVAAAERAVEIMKRIDPQESKLGITVAYGNLADARWAAGDRPGAMAFYRRTVDLRRRLNDGQPSEALVASLATLGQRSFESGDQRAGIALLTEALAMRRRLWDGPRINVAGSLDQLARAHEQAGALDQALVHYREAYEMRAALFPDGANPLVVRSLEGLARVSRAAGRTADADRYDAQAREAAAKLAATPAARP